MARREVRESGKPLPETPGERMWEVMTTYPFRLLAANLLCMLLCIPIVTIPGAVCALNAVIQQYYRGKHGGVLEIFFREFKNDFLSRIVTSALMVLPVSVGVAFVIRGGSILSYVICAVLMTGNLVVAGWFFPQLALLKLKPHQALRNAVLLLAIETRKNLWVMLFQLIPLTGILLFWPLSLLVATLFMPILPCMLLTVIVLPVLEERIVGKHQDET